MAANFFVKANESFVVTLPFDISDPDTPQLVFAETLEEYPKVLQAVDEENLDFQTIIWKKPSWGMDCFLRESAYEGNSLRERAFSQEKFDTVRLRFLLVGSSFFTESNSITTTKNGNYDALSSVSEDYIKQIDPFVLKIFMAVAASVWDLGVASKRLMTKEDYLMLRNDPDGFRKVAEIKRLITPTKKKVAKTPTKMESETLSQDSLKPASVQPTAEIPTG